MIKNQFAQGEWGEPIVHLVVTVLLMCSCSPTSMYFQVKATAEFDMRWFIPVKFALSTVLQIFLGAAAFNEWREVDFDDLGMLTKTNLQRTNLRN